MSFSTAGLKRGDRGHHVSRHGVRFSAEQVPALLAPEKATEASVLTRQNYQQNWLEWAGDGPHTSEQLENSADDGVFWSSKEPQRSDIVHRAKVRYSKVQSTHEALEEQFRATHTFKPNANRNSTTTEIAPPRRRRPASAASSRERLMKPTLSSLQRMEATIAQRMTQKAMVHQVRDSWQGSVEGTGWVAGYTDRLMELRDVSRPSMQTIAGKGNFWGIAYRYPLHTPMYVSIST
ncbi:hypothetical protein CYMTET_38137 [Cymbomonas tetramitiformis]|uniref:Uncharacterized protein n=1 Tax=Cymbomonas tetramitiformis TaxID=36881 RepID=A0AAE0CDW9_9CHLO|nr:hypothetical protein CYMTET_38137 [Cymbomonas tetramitiformis]